MECLKIKTDKIFVDGKTAAPTLECRPGTQGHRCSQRHSWTCSPTVSSKTPLPWNNV